MVALALLAAFASSPSSSGPEPGLGATGDTDPLLLPVVFTGVHSWHTAVTDLQTNALPTVLQVANMVVVQADRHIVGLRASSGKSMWEVDLSLVAKIPPNTFIPHVQASRDNCFVLTSSGDHSGAILRLDPSTGHVLWRRTLPWPAQNGCACVVGHAVVIAGSIGNPLVLDLRRGIPVPSAGSKRASASSIAWGTMGIVGGRIRGGQALLNGERLDLGSAVGARVWNGNLILSYASDSSGIAHMDLGSDAGLTGIVLVRPGDTATDLWRKRFTINEDVAMSRPSFEMPFACDKDGGLLTVLNHGDPSSSQSIVRIDTRGSVKEIVANIEQDRFRPVLTSHGIYFESRNRIECIDFGHRLRTIATLRSDETAFVIPAGLLTLRSVGHSSTRIRLLAQSHTR
jgi:hypothetical protein